jgi:cytidylate kinase
MENTKFIITINREFGSGGREIAQKLSELLDVKLYDKAFLATIREKFNLTEEEAEKIKAEKPNWWAEFCRFYKQFGITPDYTQKSFEVTSKQLYHAEAKALRDLAEQEACVIVGRSGFHVFKDTPNTIKIFLIAEMEHRVKRIMEKYKLDEKEARKLIDDTDKARENYTKTFAEVSRYDARNYDLVINVTPFTTDQVAQFLAYNIRLKYKTL